MCIHGDGVFIYSRDLHRDLPMSERKKMLDSQIQKVEVELNNEIADKESILKVR